MEVEFSNFFIKRLNQYYKLNYVIKANTQENVFDTDVDTYAISTDKPILNLQLKTGEPELDAFWGSRKKHGSGTCIIDGNIEDKIKKIIQEAEQKYSNKSNLVLLICEKMQPTFDPQFAEIICRNFENISFKGVYIVKLPFSNANYPYEGQIIAIKDIFENHGLIF